MVGHFGLPELIMMPIALILGAIPIVSVVLLVLMYMKVSRIERILTSKANL
jgi:hypothetical protein